MHPLLQAALISPSCAFRTDICMCDAAKAAPQPPGVSQAVEIRALHEEEELNHKLAALFAVALSSTPPPAMPAIVSTTLKEKTRQRWLITATNLHEVS